MNKKILLLVLSIVLGSSLLLTACGGSTPSENNGGSNDQGITESGEKKTVTVTTTFLQDMVHVLAPDMVNVELIIPAGEDPHLYLAKPQDLDKMKKADLLLYHGIHFEGKMVDALEEKGVAVAKNFDHSKIGEMDQDGEIIEDPHFWFDLDLYAEATKVAAEELENLLPEHKDEISENLNNYLEELKKLDEENKEALSAIPEGSRYLITPHDAFNYFSRRYDIGVMAPQGVSTDSEVANKDVEDTVNFIVDHQVKAIFAESTTDPARMEKLQEACKNKGHEVKVVGEEEGEQLFSDSLAPKGQDGDNFLDMYRHNVRLISENLK
ncbi:MAG: zinc ABC transporter substrate-binding protein [Tissierellia bacterium]|nr:zinc ABC transporter substrate-binding protein [Tissierellia bacterium]